MCAFWAVLRAVFSPSLACAASFLVRAPAASERMAFMTSCSARWAYQISMLPIAANPAMASR